MKTIRTAVFLTILFSLNSQAQAQLPSLSQLSNSVDQLAGQLSDKSDSILGFQKLKMPKLLDGLVDVRLKKPTIPGLGLLDKIKNFGNPNAATTAPTSPLASLGNLFRPQSNQQGILSKLLGSNESQTPSLGSLLGNGSIPNLGGAQQLFNGTGSIPNAGAAAQQFQQQAGQFTQSLQNGANQLFGGQAPNSINNALQPPLQTARQYSEQLLSR